MSLSVSSFKFSTGGELLAYFGVAEEGKQEWNIFGGVPTNQSTSNHPLNFRFMTKNLVEQGKSIKASHSSSS